MTDPDDSPKNQSQKELLFDDADAEDGAEFRFKSHAEYPPIRIDTASELLERGELIVPTQWWEGTAFLEEASTRSERWNAEVRLSGEQVHLGEGPQALIDTVYFISDGEFSRKTLKNIVETADMDAIETTVEKVDGKEAIRLWWDE